MMLLLSEDGGKREKRFRKNTEKKKIVWDNVAGLTVSFCCTLGLVFGFIMLIMLHQSSASISNTVVRVHTLEQQT